MATNNENCAMSYEETETHYELGAFQKIWRVNGKLLVRVALVIIRNSPTKRCQLSSHCKMINSRKYLVLKIKSSLERSYSLLFEEIHALDGQWKAEERPQAPRRCRLHLFFILKLGKSLVVCYLL
jgi:hypothetical protein